MDAQGNLWAIGPGGIWVLSPEGVHVGTVKPTENQANACFGEDGKTLLMTARTGLYQIRLKIAGGDISRRSLQTAQLKQCLRHCAGSQRHLCCGRSGSAHRRALQIGANGQGTRVVLLHLRDGRFEIE